MVDVLFRYVRGKGVIANLDGYEVVMRDGQVGPAATDLPVAEVSALIDSAREELDAVKVYLQRAVSVDDPVARMTWLDVASEEMEHFWDFVLNLERVWPWFKARIRDSMSEQNEYRAMARE